MRFSTFTIFGMRLVLNGKQCRVVFGSPKISHHAQKHVYVNLICLCRFLQITLFVSTFLLNLMPSSPLANLSAYIDSAAIFCLENNAMLNTLVCFHIASAAVSRTSSKRFNLYSWKLNCVRWRIQKLA